MRILTQNCQWILKLNTPIFLVPVCPADMTLFERIAFITRQNVLLFITFLVKFLKVVLFCRYSFL